VFIGGKANVRSCLEVDVCSVDPFAGGGGKYKINWERGRRGSPSAVTVVWPSTLVRTLTYWPCEMTLIQYQGEGKVANIEGQCVFCGEGQLVASNVSFPEKRRQLPISMRRDGAASYIEEEFVDFEVKRCAACGFVHLFHFPADFRRTTIK